MHKNDISLIEGTVGKTSVIQRYLHPDPSYPLNTIPTIGYEFCKQNLKIAEDLVQVHFWDTAGQDKFKKMMPTYFKKAAGCIWVYDITNRDTFENIETWLEKLKELGDNQSLLMVVGNKVDNEAERAITESEGAEFAKSHNAAFFEISAQSGYNVSEMFDTLINEIYKDIKYLEAQNGSVTATSMSKSYSKVMSSSNKSELKNCSKTCSNWCIF